MASSPPAPRLDLAATRDLAYRWPGGPFSAVSIIPAHRSPVPDGRLSRRRFVVTAAGALAAATATAAPPRAARADATSMTLAQAADAIRAGRQSSADLTRDCLARIERLQPTVNAFITVTGDQALAAARERDAEARAGRWRGPLHGIPIALKDNIDTAGVRTSGASAVFADRVPTEDAEVVRRLKEAGAVVLGKLNMDEFAAGGTSTVSYWGPVRNPWMHDRSAGGSSGGSAAAVAAELCYAAMGTDTTGSLRIPAAFCGVTGLKPTYGRVSARGVIPLSWTLDHVGPVPARWRTRPSCCARSPATTRATSPRWTRRCPTTRPRCARPRSRACAWASRAIPSSTGWTPRWRRVTRTALAVLRGLVAEARDVALPPAVATPLPTDEEMYAYHAEWFAKVPHLYQPSTRKALEAAAKITAQEHITARREIAQLRRAILAVFQTVDVLVTPTVKIQPRTIEEAIKRSQGVGAGTPELVNTSAFNTFGIPAISIPCGFTAGGLPVGLQLAAAPFDEGRLLAVARAYEQVTDWHTRRPRT